MSQVHGQSDLLRRQNAQKLQLERTLAMDEQAVLEGSVRETDEKRRKVVEEMAEKLVVKLHGRTLRMGFIFNKIVRSFSLLKLDLFFATCASVLPCMLTITDFVLGLVKFLAKYHIIAYIFK